MTADDEALWGSLSPEMKHEVAVLAAAWQSRRATRIEFSDDKEDETMMETGYDDTAPAPVPPVHSGYTMAHAHYNATMAEGQPTPARTLVLERALEQHRLALGQTDSEHTD
ncbi:hypothetical protein D1007_30854 [Hordeum vulgare]|nr:hypothetical protein D1007_30854 [Hordeum vulgare]